MSDTEDYDYQVFIVQICKGGQLSCSKPTTYLLLIKHLLFVGTKRAVKLQLTCSGVTEYSQLTDNIILDKLITDVHT